MVHTKYQDSMPCGFRQEDLFYVFPIYAYVYSPGQDHFCSQRHIFNKLDGSQPADAINQISMDIISDFRQEGFFPI